MDKNHGPRNGNAPHGSEAKGETKSTPNSNISAPLRDDPLQGWFDLSKPARARLQKKSWSRKQRGFADIWAMWCVLQIYCIVLSILWGATI